MSTLRRKSTLGRKKSLVLKVHSPRDVTRGDDFQRFVSSLNEQLALISDRFSSIDVNLEDFVRKEELPEELAANREQIVELSTSEAENSPAIPGQNDAGEEAAAAIENALPINAPPNVAAMSSIGTTFDPTRFSLEDHTHGGVLGAPPAGGTAGQVAFFTSSFEIGGDPGLTYDSGTDTLTLGTAPGGTGTLRGPATAGQLDLGSDSDGVAGLHIKRNVFSEDRLIVGPGPDPTDPLVPGGLLSFLVSSEGAFGTFFGASHASTTAGPVFFGMRSRGTLSVPLETLDNDQLLRIAALGYDSDDALSVITDPCAILFIQDGNASSGIVPGRLEFATTDSAGSSATRVAIDSTEMRVGDDLSLRSFSGFGVVVGTHDTTGGLVLAATDNTTLSGQPIILDGFTTDLVGDNSEAIRFGPGSVNIADDPGVSQARFSMLSLSGPFVVTDDSEGGPIIQLLLYAPEITNTPGVTDILSAGGLALAVFPTFTADTDACTVDPGETGVLIAPTFASTGGGTIGGGSGYGCIDSRIDTDAGVSLSLVYGMFYEGVKGTGDVDTDVAFICIDATATVNTVQQSFVSEGPLREMRHHGQALFGVGTGSPATSAGIELQSTTTAVLLSRMDDTEEGALTAVEGMVLYNEDQLRFRGYEDGAWISFVMQLDTVSLQAQTATIGDTNLANTGTPGLFRVSVYALTTTGDAGAGSISVDIKYTDDFGAQTITVGPVLLTVGGTFAEETHFVQTASGNVTYGVTNAGGFGTADYSLYVTAERL